jgi:hypothetical protein
MFYSFAWSRSHGSGHEHSATSARVTRRRLGSSGRGARRASKRMSNWDLRTVLDTFSFIFGSFLA